jgi:hypothetical protein
MGKRTRQFVLLVLIMGSNAGIAAIVWIYFRRRMLSILSQRHLKRVSFAIPIPMLTQSATEPGSQVHICDLPLPSLKQIAGHLSAEDLESLRCTCTRLKVVAEDQGVWKSAYCRRFAPDLEEKQDGGTYNWRRLYQQRVGFDHKWWSQYFRKQCQAHSPALPPLVSADENTSSLDLKVRQNITDNDKENDVNSPPTSWVGTAKQMLPALSPWVPIETPQILSRRSIPPNSVQSTNNKRRMRVKMQMMTRN